MKTNRENQKIWQQHLDKLTIVDGRGDGCNDVVGVELGFKVGDIDGSADKDGDVDNTLVGDDDDDGSSEGFMEGSIDSDGGMLSI